MAGAGSPPDFGVTTNLVEEADNSQDNEPFIDGNNEPFIDGNNHIDYNVPGRKKIDKNMVQLKPMSPFVASATVVNLLLATGPFS